MAISKIRGRNADEPDWQCPRNFECTHRLSYIKNDFIAVVNAIFLNLLKYGDLYEVDKILLYRFNQGSSTTGIINQSHLYNKIPLGTIFPYISFNSWCLKNIGLKNVLRNLDIFARMNVGGFLFFGIDLILKIRNRFL